MAKQNHLERAFAHHAVNLKTMRASLRKFREDIVADVEGTTAGVHNFGVFYTHISKKSWLVRHNVIYQNDARTLLKLRNAKQLPSVHPGSSDLRVAGTEHYLAQGEWLWTKQTREPEANWVLTPGPNPKTDPVYGLSRHLHNGVTTRVFWRNDATLSDINNCPGITLDTGGEVLVARYNSKLTNLVGTDFADFNFTSWLPTATFTGDPTGTFNPAHQEYGALVLAAFRAVQVTLPAV